MLTTISKNQIIFWINSIPVTCCALFESITDLRDGDILIALICGILQIKSMPSIEAETTVTGCVLLSIPDFAFSPITVSIKSCLEHKHITVGVLHNSERRSLSYTCFQVISSCDENTLKTVATMESILRVAEHSTRSLL